MKLPFRANSTGVGQGAESAVANYLTSQGFTILALNWKTKVCEIDIIAKKDEVVYFVEVKYRGGDAQGSGLEYITPKKLNQIKFASRVWCSDNNWGGDYQIVGAEVSGADFEDITLVEITE